MDKYGLIGNPVKHSLSPVIHSEFAKQTQQSMNYVLLETAEDELFHRIEQFRAEGGKGVNITVPYKERAYFVTTIRSEIAEQAQAVNTLMFNEDGTTYADNTDGVGLVRDLENNHQFSFRKKSILLLGAGGSARGIVPVLLNLGLKELVLANRSMEKAISIAKMFELKGPIHGIGLEEIEPHPYDLVINATSASLYNESLSLPSDIIGPNTWCYDLLYGKLSEPFLSWAYEHKAAKTLNGIGMLVEQAAAAFYLWRLVKPDTKSVIEMLKKQSA